MIPVIGLIGGTDSSGAGLQADIETAKISIAEVIQSSVPLPPSIIISVLKLLRYLRLDLVVNWIPYSIAP